MARIQFTSMEAYRKAVVSGRVTTIKDRIMRFLFVKDRPVTRRQMENYFDPRERQIAFDGQKKIRWSSMTGSIAGLVKDGYIKVSHEGICPITKETAQFLVAGDSDWDQRRLF